MNHSADQPLWSGGSSILLRLTILFCVALFACQNKTRLPVPQEPVATVCQTCPQIANGQDTLEFVDQVRRFVAERADAGLIRNERCDTFTSIPIEQFPVEEFLRIFAKEEGVASCGLAATIMVKILLESGVDAYTYNFGFKDSDLAHVVVLVKQGGQLLVFDPFMNYTLLNVDGNNMAIADLISAVATSSLEARFSNDTVVADMVVDFSLLSDDYRQLMKRPGCSRLYSNKSLIRDSVYRMEWPRCFACAQDSSCVSFVHRFEQKLRRETGLTTFHEAMTMKIYSVYGAPDHRDIDDMIETLIYSQPQLSSRLRPN